MAKKVTLGLVQMSMEEDPKKNLDKAVKMIKDAGKKGAEIVCLPELFTSPYFPQEENGGKEYAEEIPGKPSRMLSKAAEENNIVLVAGSVFEKKDEKFYNSSMVFDSNGEMLGIYRKMHVPHDEKFYEQNYFSKGDLGFRVFETKKGKISAMICYDQWFPESARISSLMGAEILFYPTAIGTVKGVEQKEGNWHEAWETVQRGHAIANNVIVAAVNRVGKEKDIEFWGKSFVCNAFGKILARGDEKEEIVIAECDLEHGREIRKGWGFFRNRRPDAYKKLTEKK